MRPELLPYNQNRCSSGTAVSSPFSRLQRQAPCGEQDSSSGRSRWRRCLSPQWSFTVWYSPAPDCCPSSCSSVLALTAGNGHGFLPREFWECPFSSWFSSKDCLSPRCHTPL